MPTFGVDGRLLVAPVLFAITFAPISSFSFLSDDVVFYIILALFVVVSIIGTRVVLACGELPANDELFDLPERLTPAQRAALRGDHAVDRAVSLG